MELTHAILEAAKVLGGWF